MAHRYLYYILGIPVLTDEQYDKLEYDARFVINDGSPIHGVGSDLESDYNEEVRKFAQRLLQQKKEKFI